MKWNDSSYECIERRARIIHAYPPLWDGVCAISAHAVERALQLPDVPGHDMGIYLRGLNIGMAEQFLQHPDVYPVFQHMRGKAVPQGVAADPLIDPGLLRAIRIMMIPKHFPTPDP